MEIYYQIDKIDSFRRKIKKIAEILPFTHLPELAESGSQQLPSLSGSFICGKTQAHLVPFPRVWALQHVPGFFGSSICGEIHP